jgi:hypothetical protein
VFKNGYAIPRVTVDASVLTQGSGSDFQYDPALTYTVITKPLSPSKFQRDNREFVPPNKTNIEPVEYNVLSFEGYFIEPSAHTAYETERIRKVTVNYFLEDNTILVKEKKNPNSGLVQGVLIKRQKIPKNSNDLASKDFYTVKDLNVDTSVVFFAKEIHLIDCDFFTRVSCCCAFQVSAIVHSL